MVSKRTCFESFEVESVGNFCGLSWCVLASLLVVPDVNLPFSNVSVVCEMFSSGSDCEFVVSQTLSLSGKRKACVALEGGMEMNVQGDPVQAVQKLSETDPSR